ncbi:hypothetical protein B0T16DRAFT_491511 [Cercophora newfieldiana]|uniref:Uncharacterized protein n=1 Tax=Cercophora newfieldiana TaxID=92897 RepID=A0AA39YC05_9PEZI|nr:hypothetical protein B0T16DRAFT_491511 [Cercophora newfieldiana]
MSDDQNPTPASQDPTTRISSLKPLLEGYDVRDIEICLLYRRAEQLRPRVEAEMKVAEKWDATGCKWQGWSGPNEGAKPQIWPFKCTGPKCSMRFKSLALWERHETLRYLQQGWFCPQTSCETLQRLNAEDRRGTWRPFGDGSWLRSKKGGSSTVGFEQIPLSRPPQRRVRIRVQLPVG